MNLAYVAVTRAKKETNYHKRTKRRIPNRQKMEATARNLRKGATLLTGAKIIAFDQSTNATGWAVLEQGTGVIIKSGVLRPKGETNDRIRQTIKQAIWLCEEFEVTFVFIEGIYSKLNPEFTKF